MPKYAARVDANQRVIVKGLRQAGASVEYLHAVGKGVPDLLVGFRGDNYILEVKDGDKPPSERKLRPAQKRWHAAWRGQVATVLDLDQALQVIGVI